MIEKILFKAAPGAQFAAAKAQEYGRILFKLSEKHGGLTPELVVDEAQGKDSPIHDYFEWDDTSAGKKWRLEQARKLMSHILVIKKVDGEPRKIRAFFNVNMAEPENGGSRYVTVFDVSKNPDYRKQIIKEALREIIAWKQRYSDYKELGSIFGAIEQTQKKLGF